MAMLGDIQTRGQITDVKQVMNYVYQLEEQMRYTLKHLDSGNIEDGAIGAAQLSSAVKAQMTGGGQTKASAGKTAARLKTDNLRIDNDGIRQDDGTFQVTGDEESYLHLGGTEETPALSLDASGAMAAQTLTLAAGRAPGMRITLEGGTGESTAYQIAVGPTKPDGHGIIWLKTGTEGDNGHPCDVFFIK